MTSTAGSWNRASASVNGGEVSPRQPLVALILSFCPGLGQQYSGRLLRGIVSYVLLIIFSWVAAIGYMYVQSPALGLLLLSVPFVGVAIIALDAYLCAKRQPLDYRRKWYNQFWIYALVFLTLLVTVNPLMDYLVGKRIVRALYVTSESMSPAVLDQDLVVINKLAKPKRGDIVLIKFEEQQEDKTFAQFIKDQVLHLDDAKTVTKLIKDQVLRRVIAVAGDEVEIVGRQVILNGEALHEPYASFGEQGALNILMMSDYRMESLVVPANAYFVLADARQFGLDSRVFGTFQDDEISGVATKVFWSWNLEEGHFLWNRTAMSLQ